MKKIEDHSNEELFALTEEQKEDVIQYECASRGLPLMVPSEIEPQTFKEFPKDIHMSCIYLTVKKEDGVQLLQILQDTGIVFYSDDFHYYEREPKPAEQILIEYKSTYSPGLKLANSEEKVRVENMKKDYDHHVKERSSIVEARTQVYEDLQRAVDNAYDDVKFHEGLKAYYQECLRLSEQNETVAHNFLAKKYDAQQIEDVLGPMVHITDEQAPDDDTP